MESSDGMNANLMGGQTPMPRLRGAKHLLAQNFVTLVAAVIVLLQLWSLAIRHNGDLQPPLRTHSGAATPGLPSAANAITMMSGAPDGWKSVLVFVGNSTYRPPPRLNPFTQPPRPGANWTGQEFQDETIADIFSGHQGFFLDLAANDAMHLSNSFTLETQFGWRGICVEANHEYLWGLAHRKCTVVSAAMFGRTNDRVQFTAKLRDPVLGGIVQGGNHPGGGTETQEFPTLSLADLLDHLNAPRVIDYFSFDVEGSEWKIMETFPWNKYTFLTLTVERPTAPLVQKLRENGYAFVRYFGGPGVDHMYIHRSLPNFDAVIIKYKGKN